MWVSWRRLAPPCQNRRDNAFPHVQNYGRYGLCYARSMTWLRQDIIESFYHGEQTLYHNTGRCLFESPTAVLIDFSVVLQWTIYCPVSGTVAESVLSVKGWLTMHLDVSDVYLRFDRYFESSTRGSTRMTWALETKVRQLDLKNSTSREGCSPQKFCNQVSIKFTQRRTAIRQKKYFSNMWHVTKKQVVTRVDSTPTQILKGCKMPRLDLQTANEEGKTDTDRLCGLQATTPRLANEEMKQHIPWETQVVEYICPQKPTILIVAANRFEMRQQFKDSFEVSSNRAGDLDFVFLKGILPNPCIPEYIRNNTCHCREAGVSPAPKLPMAYLPIINMRTADPIAVLTPIPTGFKVTQASNQDILVLTCDQLIYQSVVEITFDRPEYLTNTVVILGGLHVDFVGSIGSLMADSGLKEILSTAFGSVEKMLQGKKFLKNIRALRSVIEDMFCPVLVAVDSAINDMDELHIVLDRLSSLSRTTKMWVRNTIKSMFLMMLYWCECHEGDWPLHVKIAETMLSHMFRTTEDMDSAMPDQWHGLGKTS